MASRSTLMHVAGPCANRRGAVSRIGAHSILVSRPSQDTADRIRALRSAENCTNQLVPVPSVDSITNHSDRSRTMRAASTRAGEPQRYGSACVDVNTAGAVLGVRNRARPQFLRFGSIALLFFRPSGSPDGGTHGHGRPAAPRAPVDTTSSRYGPYPSLNFRTS